MGFVVRIPFKSNLRPPNPQAVAESRRYLGRAEPSRSLRRLAGDPWVEEIGADRDKLTPLSYRIADKKVQASCSYWSAIP